MNLFSLYAELGLKDDGYRKGIKDATSSGKNFASGLVSSVSAGTIALGNLMADAVKKSVQTISSFASEGLKYNRTMEDYNINFRTLLGGSSEAASQMVGALEDMAAKTPFAMEHLASSTQTLLSFGIESERVLPIMTMLGDISMGNAEKFSSLSRAFGQISAAGKLSGEDLNQLIDQGFNPLQTIAETTGATMADLKAVMSGQKTSKEFNQLMKDAQKEVKKLGEDASEGAKMLVQMGEDGAISADLVTQVFQKVTEEGGLFYGAMESASQSTSGMISTLEDNWNALLGSVFKPASEFMQSTLLPNAIAAVDALQTGYNEAGFQGMFDALATMATDLGTKLTETLSNAGTQIVDALPGLIESVTTWATEKKSEILTSATELFAGFSDAFPTIIANVETALPGILAAITTFAVGSKLQLATDALTLFDAIPEALTTAITAISGSLPGIVSAVTDFVVAQAPVLLEQATTLFAGIVDGVSNAVGGVTEALPDLINSFVTSITENLPQLLELGGKMVGEIISGIVGAIPTILTAGLGFVMTLVSSISSYDWLSIGSDIIAGLLSGIQSAAASSLEAIKQAFVDIWEGIKEVFGIHSPSTLAAEAGGFLVEGFANGVISGVSTFGETIKAAFVGIWEGIKSIFGFGKEKDTSGEDAEQVGTSIVEGLATGLGGEENSAVTNATSLGTRIIEAIKTALDISEGVSNMAVTIGGTVVSGVDQGMVESDFTSVSTVGSNLMAEFVSTLSISGGVSGYFKPVGSAIASGIAQGIRDNESSITSAARAAAKAAYNAAMKALDAHSPSREMMKVGKYYAEGFALGIAGNTSLVAEAARSTAQQAVYGSYMGDMNITQNISAVAMSPNELAMQTANALQLLRFA